MNTSQTRQEFLAHIQASNAQFLSANSTEQRMMIADDILKALNCHLFKPHRDGYCEIEGMSGDRYVDVKGALEANDTIQNTCLVCGIGGASALLALRDQADLEGKNDNLRLRRDLHTTALAGWFDSEQLDLIEAAYERGHIIPKDLNEGDYPAFRDAVAFGMKRGDDTERLHDIWENVSTNLGVFRPDLDPKHENTPIDDQMNNIIHEAWSNLCDYRDWEDPDYDALDSKEYPVYLN